MNVLGLIGAIGLSGITGLSNSSSINVSTSGSYQSYQVRYNSFKDLLGIEIAGTHHSTYVFRDEYTQFMPGVNINAYNTVSGDLPRDIRFFIGFDYLITTDSVTGDLILSSLSVRFAYNWYSSSIDDTSLLKITNNYYELFSTPNTPNFDVSYTYDGSTISTNLTFINNLLSTSYFNTGTRPRVPNRKLNFLPYTFNYLFTSNNSNPKT